MTLQLIKQITAQNAVDLFADMQTRLKRPSVQRLVFLIAALVFVAGVIVSYSYRPDLFSTLSINYVLFLSLVLAPLLIVFGALIFQITCRVGNIKIQFIDAIKISVLSSAANYLPLPAGLALRVAAMMNKGVPLKNSAFANIATALVWFGMTFIHASIWAASIASPIWLFLAFVGALCLFSGIAIIWSISHRISDIILMMIVGFGAAVVYAVGFWVSLTALGFDGAFSQAVVISVAGVIGAAVSFVPSGLGVRELAAATIALWVASDPALGFMASAVLQLTLIIPLIAIALLFSITMRSSIIE